jgi:lipopolysaccharide/colanic/teichoic acid biosynthesis glycosyltransferase
MFVKNIGSSPRVFLSYSHDSDSHKQRVLSLCDRLRHDGIDCVIDQFEQSPAEGWPRWMVNQIEQADYVLMVCTSQYNAKFRGRGMSASGKGVKWEGAIVTQELYDVACNNSKFIPVLFGSNDVDHIPLVVKGATYFVVTKQTAYEGLYRMLTRQPAAVKREPGPLKHLEPQMPQEPLFDEDDSTGPYGGVDPAEPKLNDSNSLDDRPSDAADGQGGVATDTGTREIELVINKEFDSYTAEEQEKLLTAIKELLSIPGDIRVRQKRRGSVRLTLELSPREAEQLYFAVGRRELERFGVIDAILGEIPVVRESGCSVQSIERDIQKDNDPAEPTERFRLIVPPAGHLRLESKVRPTPYFRWKEVVERVLAAILLVPGLPLMGLLVALVRLHSRGPGIYRQAQMGKNAKVFTMYKIRTMRNDAEEQSGPVWAKTNDPRMTRLGLLLRKLHLDDLPQLINVVRGEMALIGPRPERPEIVSILAVEIRGYTDRLVVLPGVTGVAQINLPPDTTLDDVRRKLVLDLEYITQAGPWLDIRIFLSTFMRLLGVPRFWAARLVGLWRFAPCVGIGQERAAEGEVTNTSGKTSEKGKMTKTSRKTGKK